MYNENSNEGNLLSISAFAELVGTTPETLRHYHKKGVFLPTKHGMKHKNQYRYYAPTQITAFNLVRVLTEIDVPLDVIKSFADDRTPQNFMKLLNKQKDILTNKLKLISESHALISTQLALLNAGLSATENEVYVTEFPDTPIILGNVNDFDGTVDFFREFTLFCNAEHEPRLNPSYPIGGYWDSMEDFLNESSLPTRFFALEPRGQQKIAEGHYLVAFTRGYYSQTNDLPERMVEYAKKQGLLFIGPMYNIYPFSELCISDPNQYLLQAFALVKETKPIATRRTYNP